MKTIKHYAIALLTLLSSSIYMYGNGNDLVSNNKVAYELAILTAYEYLHYTYQKGATANTCSQQGQKICRILSQLVERTRLFANPAREDLAQLARDTAQAFRTFDLSGSTADRNIFVRSLINVLQATSSLLTPEEATECKSVIQQLSKVLQ